MYRISRPRLAALLAASATGSLIAVSGAPPPATASGPASTRILLMASGATGQSLATAVRSAGGRVLASYPVAGSVLADVPAGWQPPAGVTRVPDRAMRVTGTVSASAASTVRETLGSSSADAGEGLTVAVLDTGVADSAELAGRLEHLTITPGGDGGDGYGHGTFMAGLIAASGAASNGKYAGVAPAAKVLDVRVASDTGETSLSTVLAGVQAVSDRRSTDSSLRVLNVSLSTDSPVPPAF